MQIFWEPYFEKYCTRKITMAAECEMNRGEQDSMGFTPGRDICLDVLIHWGSREPLVALYGDGRHMGSQSLSSPGYHSITYQWYKVMFHCFNILQNCQENHHLTFYLELICSGISPQKGKDGWQIQGTKYAKSRFPTPYPTLSKIL